MTPHTPATGEGWTVRANGTFLRVVHGEHKTTVADGIVSEANARLIAAAPDLYEALTALVAKYGKFDGEWWDLPADDPIHAGRAALAKARGQ